MFSVIKRKFGAVDYYQLHNDHTGEFVGVIPQIGGLINDFCIESEEKLLNIFESYRNYDELSKELETNFKGVKLSPFPNRIKDGKYSFENDDLSLEINSPSEHHSIHGLLYKEPFEVLSTNCEDDSASIVLRCDYDGKSEGFPFKYSLEQEISFSEGNQLTVTTKIENKDIRSIPIGDGWHPYIKTGSNVDDLSIEFPSKGQLIVDERMIPTDEAIEFTNFNKLAPLAGTFFDDCFLLDETMPEHVTTIVDRDKSITIDVWQQGGDKGYNYLQIYTPPTRDSIAIEPMTCIPDAFNNEVGLMALAPNEQIILRYGVSAVVD